MQIALCDIVYMHIQDKNTGVTYIACFSCICSPAPILSCHCSQSSIYHILYFFMVVIVLYQRDCVSFLIPFKLGYCKFGENFIFICREIKCSNVKNVKAGTYVVLK